MPIKYTDVHLVFLSTQRESYQGVPTTNMYVKKTMICFKIKKEIGLNTDQVGTYVIYVIYAKTVMLLA